MNSISDVETGLELFHSESTLDLHAWKRKDQVTECLYEQLLLRFKSKVGWQRHGQAQKFETQEAQSTIKEFAGRTTAAESSRSAESLDMHWLKRSLVRYSMVTMR